MVNFALNSFNFVQNLCLKMKSSYFCLILLAIIISASCTKDCFIAVSGYAQGGTYTVKFNRKGVRVPDYRIKTEIDSILNAVDFSLSGYNKASLLSRYNAGETIEPDIHFRTVTELSSKYKEITGGAFDVWSAPLFDLWGFGFKSGEFPDEDSVQRALSASKEGRTLNFNAIAQGYTCDAIASYLHSIGVKDMLVDIGEIYCEGHNPSGKPWSIGIDNPVDGNNDPGADMRGVWQSGGRACGIVTSGNYRKFYIRDGKKYAHTIDPRTGHPVQHNLLSATIVAPTASEADAYATACMVWGLEEASAFILSHKETEGLLICSDSIWTSPGFYFIPEVN